MPTIHKFIYKSMLAVVLALATAAASAQTLSTLHACSGGNDLEPSAGLLLSGNTLYGTTFGSQLKNITKGNHSFNPGSVFKLNTDGTGYLTIYQFAAVDSATGTNTDGANPAAPLVLSGSVLYGTTEYGGFYINSQNCGALFAVHTDGTGFTNLYNFTGGADGQNSVGGLVLSGNTLYGTTSQGGNFGSGTVFSINTDGSGFTTRHSFSTDSNGTNSDGAAPLAGLMLSGNTLYGTTSKGGNGSGTVFAINTDGTGFTNLYSFTAIPAGYSTNSDGAFPEANLVLSGNTLYGTTEAGGQGSGTLFALHTDGTDFTNFHNFSGFSDGSTPKAGLIISGNVLYGTASAGSTFNNGNVFAINTDGTGFAALHDFSNNDGNDPVANLVLSGNILYGTTLLGGTNGSGTVFALNPTNALPPIPFTASPTNGTPSLTVQFTGPTYDSNGNPLTAWYWNYGDGTTSANIQNPSHTYVTNATYTPSLLATNNQGKLVPSFGPLITVAFPTLTNGANQTGAIAIGATNSFSFTGTAGDSIYLRLGTTNFAAELRIYGPNGALLAQTSGLLQTDVAIDGTLPGTGTYTVVVSSQVNGEAGTYVLRLAQLPEPYVVPPNDEGGPFTGATRYFGQITLGDIDMWSFTAFQGDPVSVELKTTNFNALLQFYYPGGVLHVSSAGLTNTDILLSGNMATNGTFTVLITGQFSGSVGTYGLTVNGLSGGLKISKPIISGTNLVFGGVGGSANDTAILYATTNPALPLSLWTPVYTNHFDPFGVYNATNLYNPALPNQFFRLTAP